MRRVLLVLTSLFIAIGVMAYPLVEDINKKILKQHPYKEAVKIISEKSRDPSLIRLRGVEFDPLKEVPTFEDIGMEGSKYVTTKGGEKYYIVQFISSVKNEWKETINSMGGKVISYVPNHAYIVKMPLSLVNEVENLSFVRWVGEYKPAYRVNPRLIIGKYRQKGTDDVSLMILLYKDEDISNVMSSIKGMGAKILDSGKGKYHDYVKVNIDEGNLYNFITTISQYEEVELIDEYEQPIILNDWSRWIVQSFRSYDLIYNDGAYDPVADTVSKWYAQSDNSVNSENNNLSGSAVPIYAHGIYGQGQIVGISDTGLDYDNAFFRDPTEAVNFNAAGTTYTGSTNHRKIVGYQTLADDYDLDSSGHGTHTSGSIAGDKPASLGYNDPTSGIYDPGDGIAPLAKLAFQDVGDSNDYLTGIPSDLNDLFAWAYDAGARIHSDSWGSSSTYYTTYALNIDEFTSANPDMVILFANGNAGPGDNTVGSPATAKNVIAVGATQSGFGADSYYNIWENPGTNDDYWGYNWNSDGLQDNTPGNVAWFSSHGPTDEGLLKPTICAPGGHWIWSADSDGDPTSNNSGMEKMGGTSMATPTAAGAMALIREYYVDGYHPDYGVINPSGALLKATMILSTRDMTEDGKTDVSGGYTADDGDADDDVHVPTNGQGWGRIMLNDALYFGDISDAVDSASVLDTTRFRYLWVVDGDQISSTGASNTYTITPGAGGPVKVVLSWYDPASSTAGASLINDLDLIVGVSSDIYHGNQFDVNGYSSTDSTGFDGINTDEVVWIPYVSDSAGPISITVQGADINSGPQSYALVAYYNIVNPSLGNFNVSLIGTVEDNNVVLKWNAIGDVSDVLGWKIYKNGEEYALLSSDKREFVDDNSEEGSIKYTLYVIKDGREDKIAETMVFVHKEKPTIVSVMNGIRYFVPNNAKVSLDVYDLSGRKVRTLVNENEKKGMYSIEDINLPSGIYIYKLSVNSSTIVTKGIIR